MKKHCEFLCEKIVNSRQRWVFALLVTLIFGAIDIQAQNNAGIGTTTPDASALLELSSTSSGFLVPRMTTTQRNAIASTAASLLIYNTTTLQFEYYGGGWIPMLSSSNATLTNWLLTGNAGNAATNFIGTTDAKDFIVKTNGVERLRVLSTGNFGIGTSTPTVSTEISGNLLISTTSATASELRLGSPYTTTATYTSFKSQAQSTNITYSLPASQSLTSVTSYLSNDGTGSLTWVTTSSLVASGAWGLNGNTGITSLTNFIGTTDAKDLTIRTNNTTRATITSGGYLGLGTTTPSQVLDILGNLQFSGAFMPNSTTGTAGQLLQSQGAGTSPIWVSSSSVAWSTTGNAGTDPTINFIGTTDLKTFTIRTNNTRWVTITTTGNFGLQTTTPSQDFDLVGNLQFSGAFMPGSNAGSTGQTLQSQGSGFAPIWVTSSSTSTGWSTTGNASTTPGTNFIGTTDAKDLVVKTNSIERLRVSTSGGIAIGTSTNASAQITIASIPANGDGISINCNSSATVNAIEIDNLGNTGANNAGIVIASVSNGSGTGIRIGSPSGNPYQTLNTGIDITGGTGILVNALNSGSGTGITIGGTTSPAKGITAQGNTWGVQGIAAPNGSSLTSYGLNGYTSLSGSSVNGYGVYATSGNTSAVSSGLSVGVYGSAYTAGAGTNASIGGQFSATGAGNRFALVAHGGGDIYLGSTNASIPASLTATGAISTGNTVTTYIYRARLSGPLSIDGTEGVSGQILSSQGAGNMPQWITSAAGSSWLFTGNSGTTSANFLGTTDAQPLIFKTNSVENLRIVTSGNVGIGTTSPTRTLEVNGNMRFGTNGTTVANIIKATVSTTGSVVSTTSGVTLTFSVTNVATTSTVSASPGAILPDGLILSYARVSSTGTVEIKFYNPTAGALTLPAMNIYLSIIE